MATYAYKEQALIELVAETSHARRELGSISKIGKAFQLDQMKASLNALSQIDAASRKTFQNLEKDLKKANRVAKESRDQALAAFQDTAVTQPPDSLKGDFYDSPDLAAEHKKQLKAMEANMNEFRTRMAGMDIDVGTGSTMEEDMGATMGGEVDERKKGLSVMKQMNNLQLQEKADIKKQIELHAKKVIQVKEELKLAKDNATTNESHSKHTQRLIKDQKKIVKAVDKRTKAGKEEVKKLKMLQDDRKRGLVEQKRLNNIVKDRESIIKRETKKIGQQTEELQNVIVANKDLNRTYHTALNLNQSLAAVEGKRLKTEIDATKKATKENSKLNREKQRQQQLDRDRAVLAKEFNTQIDAMATSFKTTLVTSIAASTAATTAFFNKLNEVNSTFMNFEEELMNAQSIFQASNETLFGLSDEIVSFGNKYGVSMENASEGLYTLASAGLDAEQSMEVLGNTLKLSMAVQGDHETVAKLTTQTIFGFGMEMSDSAELTDKFAHSINKSLIEYQDLASAVKFAMPFFVSTGQSVDQLLGSLEVLTNRALEAGIAGRGLRQALAEFAQHANDNTAAFAKLGVEITNSDGSFKQLTEIAKEFQTAMGPAASDVDLMTTLLEDLNVRGATAFVHLVQNADEFEGAVQDLQNSTGAATAMADVQQQSLARSIDVLKNSFSSIFLMSDELGKSQGFVNEYAMTLHNVTDQLQGMFVEMEDGVATGLTPLGQTIKDTVIFAMQEFGRLLAEIIVMVKDMTGEGRDFTGMITLMTMPLRLAVKLLGAMGPNLLETILLFKMMSGVMPIMNAYLAINTLLIEKNIISRMKESFANMKVDITLKSLSAGYARLALSQAATTAALFAMIFAIRTFAKDSPTAAAGIGALTGAFLGLALAIQVLSAASMSLKTPMGALLFTGVVAASMAAMAGVAVAMQKITQPPKVDTAVPQFGDEVGAPALNIPTFDMGGTIPMYDTGGRPGLGSRHKMVMVEPGEKIVPKSQTMLNGGGITLNIGGDIVTDNAEDFAERIAKVLPQALRQQNDIGGI